MNKFQVNFYNEKDEPYTSVCLLVVATKINHLQTQGELLVLKRQHKFKYLKYYIYDNKSKVIDEGYLDENCRPFTPIIMPASEEEVEDV
jgi:hypothetical protein